MKMCSRADELQALLKSGHWPEAAGAELRAHVERCDRCGEEAMLTLAFRMAKDGALRGGEMPAPGPLWWRAQLRRRRAALESVARPIWRAQMFAVGFCVLLGVIAAVWVERAGGAGTATPLWMQVPSLSAVKTSLGLTPVISCGALLLAMGGVAVWLSVERD